MSNEEGSGPVPSAPPGVLTEAAPARPKTKEELEREEEEKARFKKLIYIRPVGKFTQTEANMIIVNESHGFCNALKKYLLKNEHVLFASYKREFGVDPSMYVNTDGKISSMEALIDACNRMSVDLKELHGLAEDAVKKFK
ncbi:MAG: RpoL/Rpb11 RNA polymerase subunit family protein [Candidatus Sigynarchaeota archaeon]